MLPNATAMPTPIATASTATAKRLGRRAVERLGARTNMGLAPALRGHALRVDRRGVDQQAVARDARLDGDRVAAAGLPQRDGVDGRAAVAAVEAARVLEIAQVAADLARVHAGLQRAV